MGDPDNECYCEALPLEVLWMIFDSRESLSPRDVLRCRAVCKLWRDAATSYLLKYNSVQVVFELKSGQTEEPTPPQGAEDDVKFSKWTKWTNARQSTSSISDLTALISASPAFPATGIRFSPDIVDKDAFGNMCGQCELCSFRIEHQRHLVQFFQLHGSKLKSLSLPCVFPLKALQNILFDHAPNLEILNLTDFTVFDQRQGSPSQGNQCLCPPLAQNSNLNLRIKTLVLGRTCQDFTMNFLQQLLLNLPNLTKIQNVHIWALDGLMANRKTHLIHSFICKPRTNQLRVLEAFANISSLSAPAPALRELTLDLSAICGYLPNYVSLVSVLNTILDRSKNTLKILDLHMIPANFLGGCEIKIPPLPQLETIRLTEDIIKNGGPLPRSVLNIGVFYNWKVFKFENYFIQQQGRSPNLCFFESYFPRLRKVSLDVERINIIKWNKLLAFFEFKREDSILIQGDVLHHVTQLELPRFTLGVERLSQLFPYICVLKITGIIPEDFMFQNQNSVWTAFPHLKKFEMWYSPELSSATSSSYKIFSIDSFFTGLPICRCEMLLKNPDLASLCPAYVNALRTQPYIGNCYKLTEFKINFCRRLQNTFASSISAMFGFKELSPKTKIVFSFESLGLSRKGIADMKKRLAPVEPFVQILTS